MRTPRVAADRESLQVLPAKVITLALLLSSCAPSSVAIESTDDRSEPFASELVADSDARGLHVVVRGSPGVHVITDAAWMTDYNVSNETCAAGVQQGNVIVLAPVDEWIVCVDANGQHDTLRPTPRGVKLVLAHELAHYAGIIEHADHGLMAHYDTGCIGREVDCLAEELRR